MVHLIHHWVEASSRLARHCVAPVPRLHAHGGRPWGARVALAVHCFLVHSHGGVWPREWLRWWARTLALVLALLAALWSMRLEIKVCIDYDSVKPHS